MADVILERLQKDLNGYTDYYAEQLNTLVGNRVQELYPQYRRLQEKAVFYLEQLNREVERASDAKLVSKRFQQRIQEMYVTQILPDLELINASQQPFFTETLAGTLRYGYYTSAYNLERAANVVVNVPILNRAAVLGLIANPWLPDKNTYSDRIRANVQLVADKTTETVKDLVTKRLSYNEAARALKEQVGESYFNATRLIRTEMTRANALGANLAAIENADILDGKYRDATFDSRTSAYCAADADYSREHPYDLDYDTPSSPGVAGKRIPNHPHCRCRWYFILSTVGVTDHQKAGRKDDDPNSFGESYRTTATTYDEYAKERSLPSVKEMLEKDNPKRYLRPGETVESINKQVERRTFNGNTIIAAKAPWDTNSVVKSAESGILNTDTVPWNEKIKSRIAKGIDSEADICDIGGMVSEQLDTSVIREAQEKYNTAKDALDQAMKEYKQFTSYSSDEYRTWALNYTRLKEEKESLQLALSQLRTARVTEVVSQIRPVGGATNAQMWVKGSSVEVKKTIAKVYESLPKDWVDKSSGVELIAKKQARGYYNESKRTELIAKGFNLSNIPKNRLNLWYDEIALSGSLDKGSMLRCGFHEIGHRMEHLIPDIRKLESEFYKRRTAGEALQWLGVGYDKKETARFDKFINSYMGKDYGNTDTSFYELLSMGLESVYTGSYDLSKDKDFLNFILGILVSK